MERRRAESNATATRPDSGWKRDGDPIGKHVLIAESDRVLGDLYREALEPDGWEVEVFHDGQSALSRILTSTPDLLLLNTLPDLDMITLLEQLRAHPPTQHLAVIVLMDSVDHIDLRRVQELGVLGWLVKSRMTRERLSATLTELLEKRIRRHGDGDQP